jgi:hypothetical protein
MINEELLNLKEKHIGVFNDMYSQLKARIAEIQELSISSFNSNKVRLKGRF